MRIPYALAVYGKEERKAVADVLRNPLRIVPGERSRIFESRIAALFDKKHGIMVNSGSSANLLAVDSLALPKGSEVLTPALTFATTLAPLIQLGLTPVLADVVPGTYQINIKQLESRITKRTKAIMVPLLIGNVPDMVKLRAIAKKHKLFFIEDSCDALGAKFAGRPTGYYSDVSTTSFYASHIITAAGSGGMVSFRDQNLARRALIRANWGRESTLFGLFEKSEDLRKRFAGVIDGEPYDAKFIFSELGYNFQSSELNAAFGLEQLRRLPVFFAKRERNFAALLSFFKKYERFFVLPEQDKKTKTAWLAFPLTIRENAPFTRHKITAFLEAQNVQTRPIFTGNVMRQPAFKGLLEKRNEKYNFPVADGIMRRGFLIGCHHGLGTAHLKRLQSVFKTFLDRY
ncbi:DegT/DnrJ/EryC1/StrS family aminotransferase [Candidatus Kaiserbacteria bacterium]|nr:DegT/DnrJ/EryC1/StrS family aminotransferase [Candidatus Kaiserbacteria bacterium]